MRTSTLGLAPVDVRDRFLAAQGSLAARISENADACEY